MENSHKCDEMLHCSMGLAAGGTNLWDWEGNKNKSWLNLEPGMGMRMNHWERERVRLKKTFPLIFTLMLLNALRWVCFVLQSDLLRNITRSNQPCSRARWCKQCRRKASTVRKRSTTVTSSRDSATAWSPSAARTRCSSDAAGSWDALRTAVTHKTRRSQWFHGVYVSC